MPLYKKIFIDNSDIAVWRIDEDESFFTSGLEGLPEIQNENKRLQWLASRYLANEILGSHAQIVKDDQGKPWLKDSAHHISISHTMKFAAVIMNASSPVGVDMEMVNPKVDRIAYKFLQADEIASINANEKVEKLILYWSAKESLYKLYGNGGIEFKTQLLIAPFELKSSGELNAQITGIPEEINNLKIHYEFFDGHVFTYVVGR